MVTLNWRNKSISQKFGRHMQSFYWLQSSFAKIAIGKQRNTGNLGQLGC